jgi:beta-alanine--pyruvate transaminase
MAGSTGVLVPPIGYLEKLREISRKHGIVLIFDEVITAFGRVGGTTASETLGVTPDIITMAKGLTNAAVPMGAVAVSRHIHDGVVEGGPDGIELFHGYTYSGHPLAAAAALATLDLYKSEAIFEHASSLHGYWQDAVHSLKGKRHIIDIRNMGIVAAIELIIDFVDHLLVCHVGGIKLNHAVFGQRALRIGRGNSKVLLSSKVEIALITEFTVNDVGQFLGNFSA